MATIHGHGDWQIGVSASRNLDGPGWTALVEVFPPGRSPRTHKSGLILPLRKVADTPEHAEELGARWATDWIDRHGSESD